MVQGASSLPRRPRQMSPSVDGAVCRRHAASWFVEGHVMSAADETVADPSLAALRARGIERLFFNAGTDFAPLVEAYARGESNAPPFPEPILATHENLAIGMAHAAHLVPG